MSCVRWPLDEVLSRSTVGAARRSNAASSRFQFIFRRWASSKVVGRAASSSLSRAALIRITSSTPQRTTSLSSALNLLTSLSTSRRPRK
jgi:hypothetical protein